MATKQMFTVSGFLSKGHFTKSFTSKRQVNAFLRKVRKEVSDHYYYGLQIATIDAATGELINTGAPKGKPARPAIATSDVYKSHGGDGMTFLWQGKRGTYHFKKELSGAQNRAALKALIIDGVGTEGYTQIIPTMQSLSAYAKSQSYQ